MPLPTDERGSGAAVVLLHAGVADRRMWSEHLQPLAEAGFHVLAPDLPGFGSATDTAGMAAPWDSVLATLDALGLARVHLVGNSFGAAVGLRLAYLQPQRVASMVLVSALAPGVPPSERLREAWAQEESALDSGDVEAAVESVVETWLLPGAAPGLRTRVADMQRRAFELQRNGPAEDDPSDPLEDEPDALGTISVPALVVAGEHDMEDFRVSAELLAAELPRARALTLEAVGHLAPLEAPERFRALVLEFLGQGSQFGR